MIVHIVIDKEGGTMFQLLTDIPSLVHETACDFGVTGSGVCQARHKTKKNLDT